MAFQGFVTPGDTIGVVDQVMIKVLVIPLIVVIFLRVLIQRWAACTRRTALLLALTVTHDFLSLTNSY